MTIFGWDTSHYDGTITLAIARRAAAEGVEFATAKLGEGGNYDDPADGSNLKAFRDAGIRVLGGYYVPRTPGHPVADQVDHCIALADRDEPWWRDFDGWFWQVDLELWGYDNVTPATGIDFGRRLAARSGKTVVLYASKGMYGDNLTSWKPRPLWNANYGANPVGPFRSVYPGDNSPRWAAYSGQVPALLQYGSRATIAGLTTCDANAYRGTVEQLLALIASTPDTSGGSDVAGFDAGDAKFLLTYKGLPSASPVESLGTAVMDAQNHAKSADAKLDAQAKTLAALTAAVAAIHGGGAGADTDVVLAAIKAVGDAESAAVAALRAEVADLKARLGAAEQAAAAALTAK